MTTTIHWGKDLDGLKVLLREHTLDPRLQPFAKNGPAGSGMAGFWGNFVDISGAFALDSDDPAVCGELFNLIRTNMATVAYKEARDRLVR